MCLPVPQTGKSAFFLKQLSKLEFLPLKMCVLMVQSRDPDHHHCFLPDLSGKFISTVPLPLPLHPREA